MTDFSPEVIERFWAKVDRSGDCWRWTASVTANGYGQHFITRQTRMGAHRLAYELVVGPIPPGMQIDHKCHDPKSCAGGPTCPHRACVNPAHLEPATGRENTLRGNAPSAIQARKTHCKRGHEFTAANTYRSPGDPSQRKCRTCFTVRRKERADREETP